MAHIVKKSKPMKRKVFEKEEDEQFVVVCKPFRQGRTGSWETQDTNTVGEWLRRALGSKTNCVFAIYTLGKREEVIVRIAAGKDLSKILGRHRWIDIMYPHHVEKVIKEHHIQLNNLFSDIYEYNFKYNGDPGSNDALLSITRSTLTDPRREWIVPGNTPPADFPIVKEKYPAPTWIGRPKDDLRLFAIVLPIPEPLNKDASVTEGPVAPVQLGDAVARSTEQKPPPKELIDALAAFLPSNAQETKPVAIKLEPRKRKWEARY